MRLPLQSASLLRRTGIKLPGIRLACVLALSMIAGSCALLYGQSTAPNPLQAVPATLPATPAPALPNSGAAPALPRFDSADSGFGQNQTQVPAWSRGDGVNFSPASRSTQAPLQDPFQLAPRFGSLSGSTASGMSPNSAASGLSPGRQSGVYRNPFGSTRMGGRKSSVVSLFPASDGPTHVMGWSFSTTPDALPSLNQLLRGSYRLPLDTAASGLKLSYQDMFRLGTPLGDLQRPSASALFTTTDLGNGVFLSAGTSFGSHSTAGAPAASLANGTAAGPKHSSGPSVALKLSF